MVRRVTAINSSAVYNKSLRDCFHPPPLRSSKLSSPLHSSVISSHLRYVKKKLPLRFEGAYVSKIVKLDARNKGLYCQIKSLIFLLV